MHARQPAVYAFGFLIGALMCALSVVGLLWRVDPVPFAMAGLVAAAGAVAVWRAFRRDFTDPGRVLFWLLPLLPMMIAAALIPPISWDEVAYSVALPRDYAAAHRFFYNDDYGPQSAFPGNYEALTVLAFVVHGSALSIKLVNIAFGVGLALCAVQLCRMQGVKRTWWPVAFLLVLVAPVLIESVSVVKNDVAQGLFQALTICACAQYLREPRLRWVAAAGFFLGVSIGIKYSSLQFAACMVPCFLVAAALVVRQRAQLCRHLALFSAVATVVALPWYTRNLAEFGNPFFPFFESVLGGSNQFGASQLAIMQESFGGITDFSFRTGTPAAFFTRLAGGFGHVCVVTGAVGAVLAVMRGRSVAMVFAAAVPMVYVAFTLFFGYWEARYILVVLASCSAFSAYLFAFGFGKLGDLIRWRGAAVPAFMACVALLASGVWTQYRHFAVPLARWWFSTPEEFHAGSGNYWSVAQWINQNTTDRDYIGVGVNVQPFLFLDRHYFHIHPFTEKGDLQSQQTPEEFLRAFSSLGLTKLAFHAWDSNSGAYSSENNPHLRRFLESLYTAVDQLQRRGHLKPIAQVDGVTMFDIIYGAPP